MITFKYSECNFEPNGTRVRIKVHFPTENGINKVFRDMQSHIDEGNILSFQIYMKTDKGVTLYLTLESERLWGMDDELITFKEDENK